MFHNIETLEITYFYAAWADIKSIPKWVDIKVIFERGSARQICYLLVIINKSCYYCNDDGLHFDWCRKYCFWYNCAVVDKNKKNFVNNIIRITKLIIVQVSLLLKNSQLKVMQHLMSCVRFLNAIDWLRKERLLWVFHQEFDVSLLLSMMMLTAARSSLVVSIIKKKLWLWSSRTMFVLQTKELKLLALLLVLVVSYNSSSSFNMLREWIKEE